jgi:hypothetical protein
MGTDGEGRRQPQPLPQPELPCSYGAPGLVRIASRRLRAGLGHAAPAALNYVDSKFWRFGCEA